MVHVQRELEDPPFGRDACPFDIEKLLTLPDELSGQGHVLRVGKTIDTDVWVWFRVSEMSFDRQHARDLKQVRMCTRDEVEEFEKYVGNAFALIPCLVGDEVCGRIAKV